jgi:hypothetical protein
MPSFTLADIDLLPILYHVQRMPEGGERIEAAQHLAGYFARHTNGRTSSPARRRPRPAIRLDSAGLLAGGSTAAAGNRYFASIMQAVGIACDSRGPGASSGAESGS